MRKAFLLVISVLTALICISLHGQDLDRKFYNNYLDSLNKKSEENQNLIENLFKATRNAIRRNDRENGTAFADALKPESIRYQLLDQDSAYARGIFKELKIIRPARYIYIVEASPYMVLLSYDVSPGRSSSVQSIQNFVVKSKTESATVEEEDDHEE